MGRRRAGDPHGAGPRAGGGRTGRGRLRLRADARHRAGRRRRAPDARRGAAVERQTDGRWRRGLRGHPPARGLSRPDGQSGDAGLAWVQARVAARQRSRRLRAGHARADAQGLRQPPPHRRAGDGPGRRVAELPDGPGHGRMVARHGGCAGDRPRQAPAHPGRARRARRGDGLGGGGHGSPGRHAGAGRSGRLSGRAARLGRVPPGPRLGRDRNLLHPDLDRRGPAARPGSVQRRHDRGALGSLRAAGIWRRRDALGAAHLLRWRGRLRPADGRSRHGGAGLRRPVLPALSRGRAAGPSPQRPRPVLRPRRGPRAARDAAGRDGGRGLRGDPPPPRAWRPPQAGRSSV